MLITNQKCMLRYVCNGFVIYSHGKTVGSLSEVILVFHGSEIIICQNQ